MVIFALSGSLREQSSNTEILNLIQPLLPKNTEFILYQSLKNIPHYNSDFDQDSEPAHVREFRGTIQRCDAILISTPEYAHGIPGSLKNALDWLVSTTVLENKPVGLIFGSSSEGQFAQDAMVEVLKTMNARVLPTAVVNITGARAKIENGSIQAELKAFTDGFVSSLVLKS